MFTYAGLALAVLKFVNELMNYVNLEQARQEGADAEIAKISAAILAKTSAGKAIMEKINGMSDKEVDDGLRDLEPGAS